MTKQGRLGPTQLYLSFQHLLENLIRYRAAVAPLTAYLTLIGLSIGSRWIQSGYEPTDTLLSIIQSEARSVISIDNADAFSLLVLAILYFLEVPSRKRQEQYEAWQVLDTAASAKPTSYARFRAMQDLNGDRVSLRGLDVPGADLEGINLAQADLRGADLRNAILRGAVLRGADLSDADLRGADLQGADLRLAQLRDVKIDETTVISRKWRIVWQTLNQPRESQKLLGEDLSDARLVNANLRGADLRRANLRGADLSRANLGRAKLHGADLSGATLTAARFRQANLALVDLTDAIVTDVVFSDRQRLQIRESKTSEVSKAKLLGSSSLEVVWLRLVSQTMDHKPQPNSTGSQSASRRRSRL